MAFKMKGFSGFYGKSPIKQLKPGDKGYKAPAGISKDDKTVYKQYTDAEKAQHIKDNIALDEADKNPQRVELDDDFESAYENAQNDYDTDNPTKEQIAKSLAKLKEDK